MIKDIKYFDGIVIITRREMIGPISYEFSKHGKNNTIRETNGRKFNSI